MEVPADPVFTEQRPRLSGIAYRMLGSAHDAEESGRSSSATVSSSRAARRRPARRRGGRAR